MSLYDAAVQSGLQAFKLLTSEHMKGILDEVKKNATMGGGGLDKLERIAFGISSVIKLADLGAALMKAAKDKDQNCT
jgi:hypothetical protein